MTAFAYVYVGQKARANLEIGIDLGIWGWKADSLALQIRPQADVGSREASTRTGEEIAASLEVGDYLVLGHKSSKGPRNPEGHGSWSAGVTLEMAVFAQVSRTFYYDVEPVWPDDSYPGRIDLEILHVAESVRSEDLGASAMEALRYSGCQRGLPVPAAAFDLRRVTEEDDGDGLIEIDGDLDAWARALRRREHRMLRNRKFGDRPTLLCDLCGQRRPRNLVALAHIKRRTEASRNERRNLYNLMAACLIGCDALFEEGYIHVDQHGEIQPTIEVAAELTDTISALKGQRCTAFNERSKGFFAAHARRAVDLFPAAGTARLDLSWPNYP